MNRIVGIALVKNEDFFVSWALGSVVAFCDELIVLDNHSSDGTPGKLAGLARRYPNVSLHRIDDPNRSHRYIESYAGTRTWVFGVDGDEVHDPSGLARLRPRIVSGELDAYWRIAGHVLNATEVDLERGTASGYVTPAAPAITKLFNFGVLKSWVEPSKQRLHGDSMVFRRGFSRRTVLPLHERESWGECDLRCLHLCFFPRSSRATTSPVSRENPSQVKADTARRSLERAKSFLRHPFLRGRGYKTRRYRRGRLVTRDISAFGRPSDFEVRVPEAEAGTGTVGEVRRVLATRASTHG